MDEEHPLPNPDPDPVGDAVSEPMVPDRRADLGAIRERTRGDLDSVERWFA